MLQDRILVDFINDIQRCQTLLSSYQLFHQTVNSLGVVDTIYAQSLDDPISAVGFSSYSSEFIREYQLAGGPKNDVSVAWTQATSDILVWPDVPSEFVTDEFTAIDEIAADCEMINGITIPILTNDHVADGSVGLCSTGIGEKEFQKYVKPNLLNLVALTQIFDIQARSFGGRELLKLDVFNYIASFKREELETVRWLAEGYSLQKIADEKLFRSIDTINVYVRDAKKKLDAKTRDQLVAKVIMLNLI